MADFDHCYCVWRRLQPCQELCGGANVTIAAVNIAFLSGRELDYPRNTDVLNALRRTATVARVAAGQRRLSLSLTELSARIMSANTTGWDVVYAGFYGQPLALAARLRWRGPLVLDAFISTWDTYCFDRKIFKPDSLAGRMAFQLDQRACQAADIVVLDTHAHICYFNRTFDTPLEKMRVLYAGCDDALFKPLNEQAPEAQPPAVLFYGSFLPLHGVDVIVRAARALCDESVRFKIIGRGQNYAGIRALASELGANNIEFVDHVAFEQLPQTIAQATICLGGHFGASDKAGRVIGAKTFQCMAMGKATIVGDNEANRELFTHGRDAWMVRMNDPEALARSIRELLALPPAKRTEIGAAAREVVVRAAGNDARQAAVAQILQDAVRANAARNTARYTP
jgi:glycosyltransferase involved in cell wall biosynthesis